MPGYPTASPGVIWAANVSGPPGYDIVAAGVAVDGAALPEEPPPHADTAIDANRIAQR